MFKKATKGFTLIELLVVIAIIGILASVVLASLQTAREKSRDTKRIADVNQIKLALELYNDTNGAYPAGPYAAMAAELVADGYLPAVPDDPVAGRDYVYAVDTGNNNLDYHLAARLEALTGSEGVLNSDSDCSSSAAGCFSGAVAGGFAGLSTDCAATAADTTTDKCYDLKP